MVSAATRFKESPLHVSRWNLQQAVSKLSLTNPISNALHRSFCCQEFSVSLTREDGSAATIPAWNVVHSNVRGPALSRIYTGADLSRDVVQALSENSAWTAALAGIPFGGGAAAIACELSALSASERNQVIREFMDAAHENVSAFVNVLYADSPELTREFFDAYAARVGHSPATFVNKPSTCGGLDSELQEESLAFIAMFKAMCERLEVDVEGLRVAIYSKNALRLAENLNSLGCVVVALSDEVQSVLSPSGVDLKTAGALFRAMPRIGQLSPMAALSTSADVLIVQTAPCGIHSVAAEKISAPIVFEASPLAITPAADGVLASKSKVIPDLLACCGTQIAAHYEWSCNVDQVKPTAEGLTNSLDGIMRSAIQAVSARATQERLSLREAAYALAVERVARLEKLRVR